MRLGITYAISLIVGALFLLTSQNAFASEISPSFTKVEGEQIAKNPTAQKILQQIELSKKNS